MVKTTGIRIICSFFSVPLIVDWKKKRHKSKFQHSCFPVQNEKEKKFERADQFNCNLLLLLLLIVILLILLLCILSSILVES